MYLKKSRTILETALEEVPEFKELACTLGMDNRRIQLPRIKRRNDLPVVLGKREVRELLKAPTYLKHRLMLGMLYGCGLRSYELCNLLRADIDFDRKTVFI